MKCSIFKAKFLQGKIIGKWQEIAHLNRPEKPFISHYLNPIWTGALTKKFLASFLGIVGMALAKYDLPTKPTNIGRFHLLAFLAFVGKKLYLPKIVGSTGGLLPSKSADLAIYLTKVYCQ